MIYDTIIIGSGPSGYTAGIYASRGNLNTLLIRGTQPGGQLTTTTVIENWPGFENGIDGNQLMLDMEKQAKRFGTEMVEGVVTKIEADGDVKKVFIGDTEYQATSVVIATGARSRMTGKPGEEELFAKGISTCATCDGFFYKEKDVIIMGGGDTAMEEANFLTNFCKSVTIVHRRDEFRASKIMADRALNNPKINVLWNTEVVKFNGEEDEHGNSKLASVSLINNKTNEEKDHPIDGVFLAIGHIPNTDPFKDVIELDAQGYIVPGENMMTSVDGVFYAGDCEDKRYRQAVTAAADGCKAAMEVIKYVEAKHDA